MREYPDNHRRLFDDGDDLQGTATLRAVFEVDIEHALEQARPAHACRRFMRVVGRISARFLRCARHNRGAQPRVGAPARRENGSDAGADAAPARPGAA